jgi:1-phosphofructokinase
MNPAIDKTAEVTQVLPGGLNRLRNVCLDAGGKGINAGKMIKVLGGRSLCTGFVGGSTGRQLADMLKRLGLPHDFIEVEGTTRTNLKVVDDNGGLTEFNEPGISVTDGEIDALLGKVSALAKPGDVVVLSGSLPNNASADTYARFAGSLAGRTVIADCDGDSFREVLKAKPGVVKPNRFELLQYFGLRPETADSELPDLCGRLLEMGVGFVALSLGADGAMFFTREHIAKAKPPRITVRSTVGAGDSMVGALAYCLEQGKGFGDTIRLAMAASVGAVTTRGTNPPDADTVARLMNEITIESIGG